MCTSSIFCFFLCIEKNCSPRHTYAHPDPYLFKNIAKGGGAWGGTPHVEGQMEGPLNSLFFSKNKPLKA